MSSIAAPVVIPYAMTQLAEGVVLNASVTTVQTILTCPAGAKVIPMFIVFRDASAAMNAATTVTVGTSVTATQYLNASALLQSMLTTTGAVFSPLYGTSVATAQPELTGTATVQASFGGTLTSNGVLKCDVLGYITFT